MKVIRKQKNSKMCIICGLDNPHGVRAPFYSMEDGSVVSLFSFREEHQSYPQRVHGGVISAMLDELGLRALWAQEGGEFTYGVTTGMEVKFRKPVPYHVQLMGRGVVIKDSGHFLTAECKIYSLDGKVLASATVHYLKVDVKKIALEGEISEHEEMCYLIEDGVTEIALENAA